MRHARTLSFIAILSLSLSAEGCGTETVLIPPDALGDSAQGDSASTDAIDVQQDTTDDVVPDIEPNTDVADDVVPDIEQDTTDDVSPDTEPDAERDAERDASDVEPDTSDPAWPPRDTDAAIETFLAGPGSADPFIDVLMQRVEAVLRAEDEVNAGEYVTALARLDALFDEFPLSDDAWWLGGGVSSVNLGSPPAYYAARMLREIARVGVTNPAPSIHTVRLTAVIVDCAEGPMHSNAELTETREVTLEIDPGLLADNYAALRDSVRLFGTYIWAITDGQVELVFDTQHVEDCLPLRADLGSRFIGLADVIAPVNAMALDVIQDTDMWMVVYPSNVPTEPVFAGAEFVTGGMGGLGGGPVFIADDQWVLRKPPHLGSGLYTDLERRIYLPQWMQHEYFHHLFQRYPEFALEAQSHQWFTRSTWPADFVGSWEPDYYAEALTRRMRSADRPLADTVRTARNHVDWRDVPAENIVGRYLRLPVENDYHDVTVSQTPAGLRWENTAGVSWSMSLVDGLWTTGADCVYGILGVDMALPFDATGPGRTPTAMIFNGEHYVRQ
ncbi:MAG: hypothetical protein ACJA1R_003258 [Flavobacteriales bacterium]|jgi:hypothetical protein